MIRAIRSGIVVGYTLDGPLRIPVRVRLGEPPAAPLLEEVRVPTGDGGVLASTGGSVRLRKRSVSLKIRYHYYLVRYLNYPIAAVRCQSVFPASSLRARWVIFRRRHPPGTTKVTAARRCRPAHSCRLATRNFDDTSYG